jgi:hypothetical protein
MARAEIIAKRNARFKTFDEGWRALLDAQWQVPRDENGDPYLVEALPEQPSIPVLTLEVGGGDAHHLKDGAYVDTICDWQDAGTKFASGEYPYQVRFNKGTRALTILLPAERPITVAPIGRNKKAIPVASGTTITIPNLWPGVTALWLLTPDRPVLHFIKTAHPCTNPQMQVIGTDSAPMLSAYYEGADGMPVAVPATLAYGVITYDFAGVPLNVRVM